MKKSFFITTLCAVIGMTTFATRALGYHDTVRADKEGNQFAGTKCTTFNNMDSTAPGYSIPTAHGKAAEITKPAI